MSDSLVFALIAVAVAVVVILELMAMSRMRVKSINQKPEKIGSDAVQEETSKEECSHFLGYLATHPKKQPVPDECFGCEKAAECINSGSTRVLSKKFVGTAEVEQR